MKILNYFVAFLILSSFVYAIDVEIGTEFDDGCWLYTANTAFSVDDIEVVGCEEIYFDSIEYCQWEGRVQLDTIRNCEGGGPEVVPEFSAGQIVLMALMVLGVGFYIAKKRKQ